MDAGGIGERIGDIMWTSVWSETVPPAGHLHAASNHHPGHGEHAHLPHLAQHGAHPVGHGTRPRDRASRLLLHDVAHSRLIVAGNPSASHQILPDAASGVPPVDLHHHHRVLPCALVLAHDRQAGAGLQRCGVCAQHLAVPRSRLPLRLRPIRPEVQQDLRVLHQ